MPPNSALVALFSTFLLAGLLTAEAQTTTGRTIVAVSGKPVRLGVHGTLRPDCTAGELPEVRIIRSPRSGVFVVRRGKVKLNQTGRCPLGTEFPAQIAMYQARADFIGEDSVTYEVIGVKETNTFTINLTVRKDVPSGKPQGATEL